MSEPEESDRRSGTQWWWLVLISLYFASTGPAVWLTHHGYIAKANPYLWAIYTPVAILATKSEFVMELCKWYLRLWGAEFS